MKGIFYWLSLSYIKMSHPVKNGSFLFVEGNNFLHYNTE